MEKISSDEDQQKQIKKEKRKTITKLYILRIKITENPTT